MLTFRIVNDGQDDETLVLVSACELTTGVVASLQELGLYEKEHYAGETGKVPVLEAM